VVKRRERFYGVCDTFCALSAESGDLFLIAAIIADGLGVCARDLPTKAGSGISQQNQTPLHLTLRCTARYIEIKKLLVARQCAGRRSAFVLERNWQ
jgi:hypothetical protein